MLRKTGRKKCRICQEIKPIADFKKYKSRYAEFCLACEPVYAKKKQEYDKEFYKNNKESLQKYYEEWRENGGREIRNISEGKRRSLKNALLSDLTIDEWKDTLDYFGNSCAYCGISEEQHKATHCTNLHKDHVVPLSKGGEYTKQNIIPSCIICNSSKNNNSLEDFFSYSESFSRDRYKRVTYFCNMHKTYHLEKETDKNKQDIYNVKLS